MFCVLLWGMGGVFDTTTEIWSVLKKYYMAEVQITWDQLHCYIRHLTDTTH